MKIRPSMGKRTMWSACLLGVLLALGRLDPRNEALLEAVLRQKPPGTLG